MTITLLANKGSELLPSEADENIRDLAERTQAGWKDLVSPLTINGSLLPPTYEAFGPSGLRRELKFDIGEYAFASAFHLNHDVKIGGKAYVHVHWSTDGVDTNTVKWEFQISRAKGHNQEYFSAESSYFVEQAPNGAWRHLIAEVSTGDAITITEPDELLLVTLRRVTNGAVDNTDKVFAVTVDFHYEANRDTTPNKAPNFYTP